MRKTIRVVGVTLETEYLVMLGLFVAGLVFLASGLTKADILLFDEGHYIGVARHHADGEFINPSWGHDSPRPYNFEHPPLAKYVMALSIVYVGDNPLGWRIPSVIVGALGYVVAYALGRNLFGTPLAGVAAAGFLAMDPMYYVHARLGVLEIFPAVLGAAAFAAVMSPKGPRHATAGLLLGLAIATKYTALFIGPPLIILAFLRSHGRRRDRLLTAGLHYILIPGAILMAAYIPYFVIWIRDYGLVFTLKFFPWLQQEILGYGYAANLNHDYVSHPLTWFLVTAPIGYYWNIPRGGYTQGWIYSMGNVATWWPALTAMLWSTGPMIRRLVARLPPRAGFQALLFVFLLSFAPYLFIQRITLIFYVSQYTPLLAVGAAGVFVWLWHRPGHGVFLASLFAAIVAAVWVIYYPVVTATQIPPEQVEWIFSVNPFMERVPIEGAYEG